MSDVAVDSPRSTERAIALDRMTPAERSVLVRTIAAAALTAALREEEQADDSEPAQRCAS